MCGIAGAVFPFGTDAMTLTSRLQAVTRLQRHRGPDASGVLVGEKVGFAHNRLSIIELSELGAQPMQSASKRTAITFNGEVYNFRELTQELGLQVQSGSDTEVILAAYEQLGQVAFAKLNGMFAFALHDRAENAVWLVRDRLGIKPLYLSATDERVVFASEIKGIFALAGDIERRMNHDALHEWVYYGNALGSRTLYHGITQLEPGCALRIDLANGSRKQFRYWSIPAALDQLSPDPDMRNPIAAAAKTRDILERSVKRHLISDVPVGLFLSGGLDSSSIACLASHHSETPLTTYSAAFDHDGENSELALAKEVATACGTLHHEFRIRGDDTADVIERMIDSHDLPFSDAANIPLYLMCRQIGQDHKVVLQGDAGDEMFAGYQRHLTLLKWQNRRALFRALRRLANLPVQNRQVLRILRMIAALGAPGDAETMALLLTVERGAASPTAIFQPAQRARLLAHDPFERYRYWDDQFGDRPLPEKMLLIDKLVVLPDIFFQKVDRSSMAASVEVRVPFADNELVEHVLTLAPQVLMQGGLQKGLLRQAMKDILPANVLAAKKRGFGVPYEKWVAGPLLNLVRDSVATVATQHPGFLDSDRIDRLISDHQAGKARNGFMIWKILNLCLWLTSQKVGL